MTQVIILTFDLIIELCHSFDLVCNNLDFLSNDLTCNYFNFYLIFHIFLIHKTYQTRSA